MTKHEALASLVSVPAAVTRRLIIVLGLVIAVRRLGRGRKHP